MDQTQKNIESHEEQREIQSDSSSVVSQNDDQTLQENGKLKEQLGRIQQILKSEKSDGAKVEECLQTIQDFQKRAPSTNEDYLVRSVQKQQSSNPLDDIVQKVKTKMEELQKQKEQLSAANQQMKGRLDRLAELKISLVSRIEGLDAGLSLRQTNFLDSLGAEQARLQKRMSAEEKEETLEDSKLFAILDKFIQKYEEALKSQKTTSQQLEKQVLLQQEKALRGKELEESNNSLRKQMTKLGEQCKAKDQQLRNEKRKLQDISAKLTNFEQQNKKLIEKLQRGDKDATKMQELQLRIKELNQELAKKKAEAKKQETLASDLTKQTSTLKKEITQKNEELSKIKEQLKKNRETLAQYQLSKSKDDRLKQDILRRNSELEKEISIKNDEVVGLNLRHRDEINSHKKAFDNLAKKHEEAQVEGMKLKTVGQPKRLKEMHTIVLNYLYPSDKAKHQMTAQEKDETLKKKQQLLQAIGFL